VSTPGGWTTPGQDPSEATPGAPAGPPPAPPYAAPGQSAAPSGAPGQGGPGGWPPHTQPPHTQPMPTPPPQGPYPGYPGGPQWQMPRAATYQPGVIPFRPLGLGDIYGAALKIIKGNPASTVGVGLLVALVALIPSTPIGVLVAQQGSGTFMDPEPVPDGDFGTDFILVSLGQYIPAIAGSLATIALAGFIAYVTGQAVMGRKVKLPETWRGTKGRLLPVIGVSLLISLIVGLVVAAFVAPGLVILVMGGMQGDDQLLVVGVVVLLVLLLLMIPAMLFLWTRFAFAAPAVVLEGVGVFASLRRSWQLTRFRGFWRILGIRILTALLASIIAQVLVIPVTMILVGIMFAAVSASVLVTVQVLVGAATTLITAAAATPITATVDTLLYVDQRMRDEALDVRLIQAVEGQAPLPWLPATDPLQRTSA